MAWNRPTEKSAKSEVRSAKTRFRRMCLVFCALCLVIGVGAWLLWPEGERGEKSDSTRRGRIKEVPSAKQVRSAESGVRSAEDAGARQKKVEEVIAKLDEQPKPLVKPYVISPEKWARLTNRTFKTGTEQLMSWVFSVQPGDMPMPIPPIGEEDRKNLAAILISKNEITDKDDERTAFCKEQVDFAKKEMAKYIGEGGDPDDFLQYYFRELKLAFDKRNDAISQLQETHEEDPELAEQLREAINKKFEEEGIRTINKEAIQ